MTHFRRLFLVAVSVCLAGAVLGAARPRYGGTLKLETTDAAAMRHANALAYEGLVGLDASGVLRPSLATSWDSDAGGRRWTFRLRHGVTLHDGSTLQPSQIAATLRDLHGDWQISTDGDALSVDPGRDVAELPWQLADSSNAIAIRQGADGAIGSGPFRLERVEAGVIALRAHDDYWDGRAFVDVVEVRTARSLADQLTDVETGRADIVSLQPTDVRRIEQRQLRIESSGPLELMALAFEPPMATSTSEGVRRTLAAAIDRAAIAHVVLQGRAEPANALLPQRVSGYPPFVFEGKAVPLSRSAVAALSADRRRLALRVTPSDPVAQAVAQRIAVNARDVGFALTVQSPAGLGPRFDLRLVRLSFRAGGPPQALSDLMAGFGPRILTLLGRITPPDAGASLEDVLLTERALLTADIIVPVVHVPELYAIGPRVQSWNGPAVLPSGSWNLANVWLNAP
jgi:peptide/nickel transport system substrate-binding protein